MVASAISVLSRCLTICKSEAQGLVQTHRQCWHGATRDQKVNHTRQLLENVVFVYRALQVMLAAAPTRADSRADHAPNHLQMAITKIRELCVDLDERVKKRKREPEKRLVAI